MQSHLVGLQRRPMTGDLAIATDGKTLVTPAGATATVRHENGTVADSSRYYTLRVIRKVDVPMPIDGTELKIPTPVNCRLGSTPD